MATQIDFGRLPFGSASRTPAEVARNNARCERLLTRHQKQITGRRVLDLGCGPGRFGYASILLGAREVIGIDADKDMIAKGREALSQLPEGDRMNLIQADAFDFLQATPPGEFDVILCIGWLYHTVRQIELFRHLGRIRPETIIIETSIADRKWAWWDRRPYLELHRETTDRQWSVDPDHLVMHPSAAFVEMMLDAISYQHRRIDRARPAAWIAIRQE
jgi:SAM-dependent methyltransferase